MFNWFYWHLTKEIYFCSLKIISNMEDIKTFIQSEVLLLAFKKVSFDESLVKSKLLDSITLVDLIVSIEEKTGKEIPQYLIVDDNFETINKIIETISSI
jgi:acyl carrier protein